MINRADFLYKKRVAPFFLSQSDHLVDSDNVRYVWSRNPSLIKQYAKIITESFDKKLNLRDIYSKISETDFRSHYRLFITDTKVVGGFRMVINDPLIEHSLPSEKSGFTFKETFKDLDLQNNRYTELSRFAVLPQYRNNTMHYQDGFKAYRDKMTELGVKYLFLCSSRSRFRVYNKFAGNYFKLIETRHLDVSSWESDYKNLEFYICVYDNEAV